MGPDRRRCPYCEAELSTTVRKCWYCGEWVERDLVACGDCGRQVEGERVPLRLCSACEQARHLPMTGAEDGEMAETQGQGVCDACGVPIQGKRLARGLCVRCENEHIISSTSEGSANPTHVDGRGPVGWWVRGWRRAFDFKGRARRWEFWWFNVGNLIFGFAVGFIDGLAGLATPESPLGPLGAIFSLVAIIPSLSMTVRRFHDVGESGKWIGIPAVALVVILATPGYPGALISAVLLAAFWGSGLVFMYWFVSDSEPGPNKYGPNPHGVQGANRRQ